ncbi:MAG TPA: hypothetical protein PKY10_14215 [Lentisphaeria bacterium]|nr:hypothetical protein [Lentisphaeria bacterium]
MIVKFIFEKILSYCNQLADSMLRMRVAPRGDEGKRLGKAVQPKKAVMF